MKDNILLITTDQQRFDTINAWGNQSIFTPHLNYMAAMGVSYKNCYASCPICVPSRTTIMTGRQGYESGVTSNATHEAFMASCMEDRSTLPAVLSDAGYQTCAKGKMHFQPARAHYGFEEMRLPLDYMRRFDGTWQENRPKIHGIGECEMEPAISTVEVKDSITTWIADESIDFLETRDPTRPFFLWTSFTKPHPPFDPCRDFWSLYEGIPLPPPVSGDWSATLEDTPQGFLAGSYENTNMHLLSPWQKQAVRRAYYACITQVDYALGRIFGALREHNLFENTWVIFTSDHGEMLGDLYPTILSMAGITPNVKVSGLDLQKPLPTDRVFYGNSLNRNFCIMEKNYKLVYSAVGNHTLLFDMEKDPMEQHDLSEIPEFADIRVHLFRMLLSHTARYTPEALDDHGQFRTFDAPRFPGDMPGRWFGFHYRDYSVDTFH